MKRKMIAMFLVGAMAVSMLTGCGSKKTAEESAKTTVDSGKTTEDSGKATENSSKKDIPELSFYMMNGPVAESERIMEKANAIIEEKIGARLNLVMIDGGTYAEKMNLMINSGDDWDLAFTASWGGINFFENAAKGAYADLTELLPKYAPETYSRIPAGLWEGVTVDGKIYASVNYQQWGAAQQKGISYRKDIVEEIGFDPAAIKGKPTLEALEITGDFLEKATKAHPEMIGWETSAVNSFFADEPLRWDMEAVGDVTSPGWIRLDEEEKVINQFETKEFEDFCKLMREWYNKGYVRKDGATLTDFMPDRQAGKNIALRAQQWPDSIDLPEYELRLLNEYLHIGVSNTRTLIPASAGNTAAVAVNARSKNIEKSVQLIELLNTDDELYKLITLGEEGIDYAFNEDGTFVQVEGKYNFNFNEWQIGQSYSPEFSRGLYDRNENGELLKKAQTIIYETDKTAEISPLTGFTFDSSSVKTELANCSAVMSEMIPALSNGSVDPETIMPQFLSRLETAGVDKIIAEKQAQYDAWRATK